jgi:thiamine biosynthesis protein ThiS
MTEKAVGFLSGLSIMGQAFFYSVWRIRMEIRLNGKPERLAGPITVGNLIREKGLDPETIVVEHNLAIVATEALDQITLEDNDSLEILKFVGGG